MAFLEVSKLSKTFVNGLLRRERVEALRSVDVRLDVGQVLLLFGPNGSGKSTFLKILATLILPTTGAVKIGDRDLIRQSKQVRNQLALVTNEDRSFFWRMTCYENLRFFCILNNLDDEILRIRIQNISEKLALKEFLHKRYDQCSTGMKRRLAIARALLSRPRLLMLDEPTNSLDQDSADAVKRILKEQVEQFQTALIYITHHPEEAKDFPGAQLAVMRSGIFEPKRASP